MKRILLVEDDKSIVTSLSCLLEEEGYSVISVTGQREAIELITQNKYDLLLVDLSLSDGNGFSVCTAAKKTTNTPVIFLTASDDEISVVTGLEMGADDYIAKPFRPMELMARIKTVLRRGQKKENTLEIEGLRIDTDKAKVSKNEQEIFLSALEYRILLVFVNNKGITITRNKLLECIWDASGEFVNDNTLNVYIRRIREKIEDDPANPVVIKTIRGMGYRLG